jgi:hypothetical protein
MLTKKPRYFYDAEAIREPVKSWNKGRLGGAPSTHESHKNGAGYVQNPRQYEEIKGANRRSVWSIATKPFAAAHFAVFPPDLVRPMIRAGSSERGVCPVCGAPWMREVEKGDPDKETTRGRQSWTVGATTGQQQRDSKGGLPVRPCYTTGWAPSCDCNRATGAKAVPATVLDPFSGAATTGLVALEEGRDYIGIELSPDYQEQIARPRLEAAKQKADELANQLTLF